MNARVAVTPSATDPLGISVKLAGYNGQATLHWGDGSPPTHTIPGKTYVHSFPAVGCYMVTALDGGGVLVARQQVVVRGSVELDSVRVTGDDCTVRVRFGDADPRAGWLPHYRIEWQDGDHEYAWGVPGWSVTHSAMPGKHEVRIVDTTSGRVGEFPVKVPKGPAYDPDFVVRRSPVDESGMTVYIKFLDVAEQSVHVWWDDVDGPMLVAYPTLGMEVPHAYRYPGHYMVTISYVGDPNPAHAKSVAVRVPMTDCDDTGARGELEQNETRALPQAIHETARPALRSWLDSVRNGVRGGVEPVDGPLALNQGGQPVVTDHGGEHPVADGEPDHHQHQPIEPHREPGNHVDPGAGRA